MNSYHDVIQNNIVESRSHIGIELNDVKCLGVYHNSIKRHASSDDIYLQIASNVSMWRNTMSYFSESVVGTRASAIVTYDPSVAQIVVLNDDKPWKEVASQAPHCAPPPYQHVISPPQPLAEAVKPVAPRTCSTRSCLLEDRSNTITNNIKKYEFKRRIHEDFSTGTVGVLKGAQKNIPGTLQQKVQSVGTRVLPVDPVQILQSSAGIDSTRQLSPATGGTERTADITKNNVRLLADKMAAKAAQKLKSIDSVKK